MHGSRRLTYFSHERKSSKSASDTLTGNYLSDESLEIAINSLQASTASIEKQCRLMEAQKRAIADIVQRNASRRDLTDPKTQRSGKSTHEKASLEFEQAELSASLRNQLSVANKQVDSMIENMPSTVDKALEKDDRLLDGLEKMLPGLLAANDSLSNADEVNQLCEALTVHLSADIRSQIDATYKKSIQSNQVYINGNHDKGDVQDTQSQREALQSELDELCREIDGLSSMAVENQFRTPISRALQTAREDVEAERALWSDYVAAALHYLIARLDALANQYEHLHAHGGALKSVSAALEAVIATTVDRKPTSGTPLNSPSKQSQKGLKPLRLVQANLSENQDPVVQVLRQLDISISDRDSPSRFAENLASGVKEQRHKLLSFSATTERALADQIAQSLAKVETDGRALAGAAFGQSEFATVTTLSRLVQEAIDDLEEKTQTTGAEMRGLDMNETAEVLRQKQRNVLEQLQR